MDLLGFLGCSWATTGPFFGMLVFMEELEHKLHILTLSRILIYLLTYICTQKLNMCIGNERETGIKVERKIEIRRALCLGFSKYLLILAIRGPVVNEQAG